MVATPMIHAAYVKDKLPVSLQNMATAEDMQQWHHLRDIEIPVVDVNSVSMLIGQDTPEALVPLEIRSGIPGSGAPYAIKTVLGWAVNGPLGRCNAEQQVANNFICTDTNLEQQVERFWKLDSVPESDKAEMYQSANDKKAISIWHETIRHREDSHYEVAIPFVQYPPALENNVDVARQRLQSLEIRLKRDPSLHAMYKESMATLLSNGYAEEVPGEELSLRPAWYLPHHAVTSPSKPGRVRVVFDCSAKHCGKSLNDVVLQGPDLTNKLIGVLLRFRQEHIAVIRDIACMFHQVYVTDRDRDLLRSIRG